MSSHDYVIKLLITQKSRGVWKLNSDDDSYACPDYPSSHFIKLIVLPLCISPYFRLRHHFWYSADKPLSITNDYPKTGSRGGVETSIMCQICGGQSLEGSKLYHNCIIPPW